MAEAELPIVVTKATEDGLNRPVPCEPECARAIGSIHRLVPAIDDIRLRIWANCYSIGSSEYGIFPLRDEAALRIEYLHTRVASICHEHSPFAINPNSVREVELPRSGALLAPLKLELACRRELSYASVGVTIADVETSIRQDGDIRWLTEASGAFVGRTRG